MLRAETYFRSSVRGLPAAVFVLGIVVAIALAAGPPSSVASPQLDAIRTHQDRVRSELDRENAAVDAMLARVGELRTRERDVSARLAREEAELAGARAELADARQALAETNRRLHQARADLSDFLVFIYKNPEIDEVEVLLDSDGYDDLATRSAYLRRFNDLETSVTERVSDLRAAQAAQVDASRDAVGRIEAARAAIDARRRSLAASRAKLEQREAELRGARAKRRNQLATLVGKEQDVVAALSKPAPQPGADSSGAPSKPVAPPSGSDAVINGDGTATAPADAPAAVKSTIAAANAITNTAYIYGGGHGSFDSSGYDCSGSVSYALHGGGFLSAPLDSTGLMTWGEGGPGSWITVYANPGHTYMQVAGLRFDTSGAPPRWQSDLRDSAGYVVRHPPGY